MEFERLKAHRKDENLEELLQEVNRLLYSVESQAILSYKKTKYPVMLILGSPRSGTTLFLQWLAATGFFCYPTNILSRFYGAPYIGAKIQMMLTKYDFNNEIFDFKDEIPFTSNLGKTKGALAPNEFWYFWRRFFHYGDIQFLNEDELKKVDYRMFVSELAAIEAVFDKPLALKAMIVNWNIPFIADILEKVLFIFIKRHPFYNTQSLLKARLNYYGDMKAWYSFKPPEYEVLKDYEPFEQVSGQIYYTNKAIEEGLKKVSPKNQLTIDYEEFCQSPGTILKKIKEKLTLQGYHADWAYNGPASFRNANKIDLPDDEIKKITDAYKKFSGELLHL